MILPSDAIKLRTKRITAAVQVIEHLNSIGSDDNEAVARTDRDLYTAACDHLIREFKQQPESLTGEQPGLR